MEETKLLFDATEAALLSDPQPSRFLSEAMQSGRLSRHYPFTMLDALARVNQSPVWHPEGNVWNHTLLVTDRAAGCKDQISDGRAFMWAALLHDIGKAPTTKTRNGKITAYDHDRAGEKMARDFLAEFHEPQPFVFRVTKLVRWHMQALYFTKSGPGADLHGMLSDVEPDDIALLCLCDRLGRGGMTEEKEAAERRAVRDFLAAASKASGRKTNTEL